MYYRSLPRSLADSRLWLCRNRADPLTSSSRSCHHRSKTMAQVRMRSRDTCSARKATTTASRKRTSTRSLMPQKRPIIASHCRASSSQLRVDRPRVRPTRALKPRRSKSLQDRARRRKSLARLNQSAVSNRPEATPQACRSLTSISRAALIRLISGSHRRPSRFRSANRSSSRLRRTTSVRL